MRIVTGRQVAASYGSRFTRIPSQRMPPSSRRTLYRVVYPLDERPVLAVGRSTYEVIDCSELGLRFEVNGRPASSLGTSLGGVVQFRSGSTVEITGEVIRMRAGTIALALDAPGVPFSHILAEQRYLRSRGYSLRD